MPVPSRFYKVIYSYNANKAIGFIFRNKPITAGDLWKYAMSIQEVEEKTGLKFFNKFDEKKQEKIKEAVAIHSGKTPQSDDITLIVLKYVG